MRFREWLKKPKFFLKGLETIIPGGVINFLPSHQPQFRGHGVRPHNDPMDQARSCYTSWLRTLVALDSSGAGTSFEAVGEIGPGDSLGVGLAALLTGSKKYYALDVVPTVYNSDNEELFDCLVSLFESRAPIPDDTEFSKARPRLSSYDFPSHIISDKLLEESLNKKRVSQIREEITRLNKNKPHSGKGEGLNPEVPVEIKYLVPWDLDDILASCGSYANIAESISWSLS